MSDINKVFLLCRLGKNPELKYMTNGTAVLDLWVASNAYRKDQDDKVNWFSITVFGKRAENCDKYLKTGSQIAVEGRLDYQQWENKDGQKRTAVKIIADNVQFVGGKRPDVDSQPEPDSQSMPVDPEPVPEDESTPVDNQEPQNEQTDFDNMFDGPIDDTDDVPF